MTALLTVEDLRVRFHTERGAVYAVNGVTFSLHPGQVLAVVGESGSGKSVTCLSLMRLLPKSAEVSGRILFGDRNLLAMSEPEIRRVRGKEIGLVYQDPMAALNPVRTIGAQIREPLRLHLGQGRQEASRNSLELLSMVGIPSPERQLKAYPHELSGGMRQRVVIAMALACRPQILLADEPTTALDVSVQAQILELLRGLCTDLDISLVLVSHDLSVVAGLADEVAVMYGGFLVERADTVQLFDLPSHPYTLGLLASLPEATSDYEAVLSGIPGSPPDLREVPTGCVFRPRCPYAFEKCLERPTLAIQRGEHPTACWADVHGAPGAAAAVEGGVDAGE